jgi:hypothetical protein
MREIKEHVSFKQGIFVFTSTISNLYFNPEAIGSTMTSFEQ